MKKRILTSMAIAAALVAVPAAGQTGSTGTNSTGGRIPGSSGTPEGAYGTPAAPLDGMATGTKRKKSTAATGTTTGAGTTAVDRGNATVPGTTDGDTTIRRNDGAPATGMDPMRPGETGPTVPGSVPPASAGTTPPTR